MRFALAVLITAVATATATASSGNDKPCLDSYGGRITEILVQQYNPQDAEVTNYAPASNGDNLNIQFPTQTQNQTPEAVPNKQVHVHVQKRTDSSTPGTQIMSPWRQVVGGIAVAVLVAVV